MCHSASLSLQQPEQNDNRFVNIFRCIFWRKRLPRWHWGNSEKYGQTRLMNRGMGLSMPISTVPLFFEIVSIVKTYVRYWISRLYVTGIAAAQLRRHLPNIDVIQIIWEVFLSGNRPLFEPMMIHDPNDRQVTLQWRHDERHGVSNRWRLDCLFNRLFRCGSKKTSKLHVTGLCDGNPTVTARFSSQRAHNAENAFFWWRHHVKHLECWGKSFSSVWFYCTNQYIISTNCLFGFNKNHRWGPFINMV